MSSATHPDPNHVPPTVFTHEFDAPTYKGKVSFSTGLFIDGGFRSGSEGKTIDVINPATTKVITSVSEGTPKDVDVAVEAAQKAFDTVWGLNTTGAERSILLGKLAALVEKHGDELAALSSVESGKTLFWSKHAEVATAIECLRYFAGWADKISGQVQEISEDKLTYTRHEPIGVVGGITPWNVSLIMLAWKLAPALATGNTIVLKPSELTPLTTLRVCNLIKEAGFPPGVVNVITGYGNTVGEAISHHMKIDKISFTGSTLVGRKIMEAAAKSNLKDVTLELGGKSPSIIYDDADLEQALKWAAFGVFWNQGQTCCAGSRIFVQEGIYDKFLELFLEETKKIRLGDPFDPHTTQGPQVSETQLKRILGYIESGKEAGAKVEIGGGRHGSGGYFVEPTVFTNTTPDMKIVREEIFGPVAVVIPFKDEEDVIRQANDTAYGLAAAVFTQNLNRAIKTTQRLKAGTTWVNCINQFSSHMPFGGFKQSGIGREMAEYGLRQYTAVKAVHINLGLKL